MSGKIFAISVVLALAGGAVRAQGPSHEKPATEAELLKVLEEHRPEAYSRLMTTKDQDPAAYQRMLQSMGRWHEQFRKLPKDVQTAAGYLTESRQRIYRLARELANADSEGDRELARKRLREEIAREFDAEQITHAYRLKQLQQEVDTLRTNLEKRAAQRGQQIETRYKQALQRAERIRLHKQRGDDEPGLGALELDEPAAALVSQRAPTATPSAATARNAPDAKRSGAPKDASPNQRRTDRERPRERSRQPVFGGGPNERDLAAMLDLLKEKRPEYYARLVALEKSNPETHRRLMRATWQWYQRWRAMPKEMQGPALIAADSRLAIEGLTLQLAHAAGDTQRAQLQETLKKTIAAGFDAETAVETNGLKNLQTRLVQMQAELDEHARNRGEIIDQRFKQHTESSRRLWRKTPHGDAPKDEHPTPPPEKPARPQPPLPESDG
ncbi:MAG: hypothetical protein ABFD92_01235 [Planctomycetaceae bacterium]|nr:hypothetical protein [Planctomycetaceae bacterium]